ncbi:cyanophycinase [Reticulibacter mediterranei]|uniref:Cyanophycinase n=1 Tax=Reticulibacter mediterranei TaxID=2778369 RepID=A0A8J3IU17_9CHLR|nr:Type 1 glutamine amidotransferase-like domain-containing protein [Reticulibacter mediterranei]GHO96196.1 cyanophycinase [Reticulibacter mediterranei]
MAGYILLEGGAEFGGLMSAPDLRAIELAGGFDVPISIIPTAAAPDNNHRRAGNNGVNWFRHLGAHNIEALPLIDTASANDATIAASLQQSRLIYLLGGFPGYLGTTLAGSTAWQAMLAAYEAGAVIAGSSAGAMVLCQYYYDPGTRKLINGLRLLDNTCVLPHHNTFGKNWATQLSQDLPGVVLLGIDERTGLIDDAGTNRKTDWRVYGQGAISIYRNGSTAIYHAGKTFTDSFS